MSNIGEKIVTPKNTEIELHPLAGIIASDDDEGGLIG